MLKEDFAYLGREIKCEERQFCTISLINLVSYMVMLHYKYCSKGTKMLGNFNYILLKKKYITCIYAFRQKWK